jgi:guanine deaminase
VSAAQTIRGPILNPRADGTVDFIPDGAIACDDNGVITSIRVAEATPPVGSSRKTDALICPPFLDAHIHIPQHPIRGHLVEKIVADFARDTLAQGVVGGAAYMTVHAAATETALDRLGEFWSVGLVLMEMNCPDYLRTDRREVTDEFIRHLASRFGRRFIMTDRFAVAVGSELRQWAARMASELGLRTQTHLNEQLREKHFVEKTLYPDAASYTDVYRRDGLLDPQSRAILAHCIHMSDEEFEVAARTRSVIAHCPTSNTLLCSGIMPLDRVAAHGIDYAICTDVGASPTTSILAEMAQYLKNHAGRSQRATPSEALYRATLAPAKMLDLDDRLGSFEVGKPLSFIEVKARGSFSSADEAIRRGLLELPAIGTDITTFADLQAACLDIGPHLSEIEQDIRTTAARLEQKVISVTLAGREVWRRGGPKRV